MCLNDRPQNYGSETYASVLDMSEFKCQVPWMELSFDLFFSILCMGNLARKQ